MFKRITVRYVKSVGVIEAYKVDSLDDITLDGLVMQLKDTKGMLHTCPLSNIAKIVYDDCYIKNGVEFRYNSKPKLLYSGDKAEEINVDKLLKYICNYGGTDSAIVYAKNEVEAMDKYIGHIKNRYFGAKEDECNCELYSELDIVD